MKLNRKFFYKIHSWIGVKLSILFFIVCFSGTLATLSAEMDWLFNPASRASFKGKMASKNAMVKNIAVKFPQGKIGYWSSADQPYLCDVVQVRSEGQRWFVFANPYTGEVQGASKLTFRRFFRDLHYYLFIPFQVGHFTVLLFGFMLFVSTVTALLFYKSWFKKLFDVKTGKGSVTFFKSLHKVAGVWSVPFTILFSVTGIWYFIERTNIGNVSKIANTRSPKIEEVDLDSITLANRSYQINYDRAVKAALSEINRLVIKDILPPSGKEDPIYLTGISDVPLVRNRANRVYIHPVTYEVVGTQRAENINTVTWLNDIADPLHFGYWGGLTTKIIWFLGGLGISGLVLTGIWMNLKKTTGSRRKKAEKKGRGWWKYTNLLVVMVVIGFMYAALIYRYKISWQLMFGIGLGWAIISYLAWYVFVVKIRKKQPQTKKKELVEA